MLSPIDMPITLFKIRVRKMAMSKNKEKRIVIIANVTSLCLDFSAFLPEKKHPNASRISQLDRIMPMLSSLPEKTIMSSLKRNISATSPLNPIVNIAIQMRLFIQCKPLKHGSLKKPA